MLVDASTYGGRCPEHKRAQKAARGSAKDQGYGWPHERERAKWARRFEQGEVIACARCKERILPGQPWHLDHDDSDRSVYMGPSHARCNCSAAGRARSKAWCKVE